MDFLRPVIEADKSRYRIQDSANRASITDKKTRASITVKGSDPARLHGAAPKLLIYDEVSQWPRNLIGRMLAALTTSRGKVPGSKALWIGTRPSLPEHPFEVAFERRCGIQPDSRSQTRRSSISKENVEEGKPRSGSFPRS